MGTRKGVKKKRRTLYVKNPAAHRDAVISGGEDRLHKRGRPLDRAKVDALCAKFGALPVIDARIPEEILGYDALGIPR